MSTSATRRSRLFSPLALLTFALLLLGFTLSNASAQFGFREKAQEYSLRFYGQNFYDGQRNGYFSRGACDRQNHMNIYGPAQMYSRQYGDEFGYATDRPFVRRYGTNRMGNR